MPRVMSSMPMRSARSVGVAVSLMSAFGLRRGSVSFPGFDSQVCAGAWLLSSATRAKNSMTTTCAGREHNQRLLLTSSKLFETECARFNSE